MDRSEESTQEAVADMDNVYIERDDQGWGGFGGIKRVILERDSLTLHLSPKMATQMGRHRIIRINFRLSNTDFKNLRRVLCLIMRGYESQLELLV